MYASDRWHNSGGDRTWLAPEVDFFLPNFPDTSTYVQPRQFDAGQYIVTVADDEVQIDTEFLLHSYRANADLALSLSKTVSLVADPLARMRDNRLMKLEFAGYKLRTSLRAIRPIPTGVWVGVWNLLQMPGGGELLAPTFFRSPPTIFFGDIPAGHLRTEDRLVRFRMEAPGEQKICISALATVGRLGYIHTDGDGYTLIVRSFWVNPNGAYRDVWHTRLDDDGYAVQACNINTASLGCFAEMEYHTPAIGDGGGEDRVDDTSIVWAYRGNLTAIREAAHCLLGVSL